MNVCSNNECHKRLEPKKVDAKINLKLKLSKRVPVSWCFIRNKKNRWMWNFVEKYLFGQIGLWLPWFSVFNLISDQFKIILQLNIWSGVSSTSQENICYFLIWKNSTLNISRNRFILDSVLHKFSLTYVVFFTIKHY